MSSILNDIKKDLGIMPEYTQFDSTIIGNINAVFGTLFQLQVGPDDVPYSIQNENNTWDEFTTNLELQQMTRPYMYMRVRLMFDPPSSSFVLQSLEKQISEAEWRLNIAAESSTLGGEYKVKDDDDE